MAIVFCVVGYRVVPDIFLMDRYTGFVTGLAFALAVIKSIELVILGEA